MTMASAGQPVTQTPQPRQSSSWKVISRRAAPVSTASPGLGHEGPEGAPAGAAPAGRAFLGQVAGDVAAARPQLLGPQAGAHEMGVAAIGAAVADGAGDPAVDLDDLARLHEAGLVGPPHDLHGPLAADLPAHAALVAETEAGVDRLRALPHHAAAVAGPQIDAIDPLEQGFGLVQQQILGVLEARIGLPSGEEGFDLRSLPLLVAGRVPTRSRPCGSRRARPSSPRRRPRSRNGRGSRPEQSAVRRPIDHPPMVRAFDIGVGEAGKAFRKLGGRARAVGEASTRGTSASSKNRSSQGSRNPGTPKAATNRATTSADRSQVKAALLSPGRRA